MAKQVFKGLKAVQFGWAGVGPLHGLHLAHYGATVIHVESRSRPDPIRSVPPYKGNTPNLDTALFAEINTCKYSVALDLKNPRGIQVAKRLVAWTDVIIENFAGGAMKRLGLDYEKLAEIKPDLIMISTSNQGQTGPHFGMPGYGPDLASFSGFSFLTGWPDRDPSVVPGAYTDYLTPSFGTAALIGALLRRRRTGKGMYLDVSQFECALQFLAPVVLDYTVNRRIAVRSGNTCPYASPYGAYRCQGDDRWCAVAVFTDAEWQSFCRVIGEPLWTKDPKFATLLGRLEARDEVDKLVNEWTANHTTEEVMALMQRAGVPAGVVQNGKDLWEDPQLRHRHYFQELEHPTLGKFNFESPPFILSGTPGKIRRPSPCLGQHNEYVYKQLLGMSDEEFDELKAEGVFE